jgi:uncharacterized SAM-binding protein YcdF (DUF218 family)
MPRKRLLIVLATVALAGVLLFLCRTPFLRATADLWIIDEPPARADAIVVLGGGLQNRPFTAATLYHRGLAPTILIFKVRPSPTTELGLTPTEQELTRQVLLAEGVPAAAILEIGDDVASTRDEARAVRAWATTRQPRSLIIPTDPFHTRRVRWLFRHTLRGTSATPTVTVAPRSEYSAANWWTHEQGLIDFQNEIIKYVFYRFSE